MTKVVQFKLVSGEEIMCKIHKKGLFNYQIKEVLMFIKRINEQTGTTYYAFVPYMTQINHKNDIITLKKSSIMSISYPATLTEATYDKYVQSEHEAAIAREEMTESVLERMKNPIPTPPPQATMKDSDINVAYSIDKSKLN